jgi:hypothetical protein
MPKGCKSIGERTLLGPLLAINGEVSTQRISDEQNVDGNACWGSSNTVKGARAPVKRAPGIDVSKPWD